MSKDLTLIFTGSAGTTIQAFITFLTDLVVP